MAEYTDEIIAFLLQLPAELEVVRQSVDFSNDLNLLEYWYRRLEYAVNVLKLVVERAKLFQQDFDGIDSVVLLLREAQLSSQSVDSRILEIQDTQHPVHEEVAIGRPRKVISREDMEREFEVFQNWKIVARQLGVSSKTLRRRRLEFGMNISETSGPRLTYTNISNEDLCSEVRNILIILPEAEETVIIGALRSRSIHVQRRRVREAINAVDPVSRALRRTVTIVRRKYNVASPNALWWVVLMPKVSA